MTTTDVVEPAMHQAANQDLLARKTFSPHEAREQLRRWSEEATALGMIYARANHHANTWARVTISAPTVGRLICENKHMHFSLSIDNATFSIESLQCWDQTMHPSDRSAIEGLQIWCADGDWLFLTEQIAQSRSLSLNNPFKS